MSVAILYLTGGPRNTNLFLFPFFPGTSQGPSKGPAPPTEFRVYPPLGGPAGESSKNIFREGLFSANSQIHTKAKLAYIKIFVEIALHLYLCMMASNCSGERSFSKLGRLKNELRSTMGQNCFNMLSILSIEHEILRSLNFTDIIDDFAMKKVHKRCI